MPRKAIYGFTIVTAAILAASGALAQKLPPIPKGNHYVCYPARVDQQFKVRKATFQDQFGKWNVYVTGITRLCTPALKRYGRTVSEPVDKRLHQVCYSIRLASKNPLPKVVTNDQFGAERLYLSPPREVCLPAGKMVIKG